MKHYTIGILFDVSKENVLLLRKTKPDWQKGKLNFPGGHVEEGESTLNCIIREFKEETDLDIPDWQYIGCIINYSSYTCDIFTAVHRPEYGQYKTMTDEPVGMYPIDNLCHPDTIIANVQWLTYFALNIIQQGNADHLKFGAFSYEFPQKTKA